MPRIVVLAALSVAVALTASVWAAPAPSPGVNAPIDLNSPEAIAAGQRIFETSCSHYCHGKDGRGGIGPQLRGRTFDNEYLFNRISNGFPPMPAWGQVYAREQIWDLVAYIQSLKTAKN